MRKLLFAISIVLAVVLAGFIVRRFVDFARDTENYGQTAMKADAIVVLTGGKGRTREGLELLRKGAAAVLIISGVNKDACLDSIFLNQIRDNRERESVILEKKSRSTLENAVEVRKLMRERGFKSMILITSSYHMKRALFIFRRVMPPDITIWTDSVRTASFNAKNRWSGNSLMLIAIEFVKYYWYAIWFKIAELESFRP